MIGLSFGLLPAIAATRADSGVGGFGPALRARTGTARAVAPPVLRRGLPVAQIAFTMMLLVGAGLMARTIIAIAVTPLGFDDVATVKADLFLSPARYPTGAAQRVVLERLLASIAAEAAVEKTAAGYPDPMRSSMFPLADVIGEGTRTRGEAEPRAAMHRVTPWVFRSAGHPRQRGPRVLRARCRRRAARGDRQRRACAPAVAG